MIVIQTGIKTVEEARVAENIVIHAYSIEKALVNGRREIAVGKISGFRTYFSNVLELYGTVLEDEILNLMSYSPFNKMGR